jgi:ribonuclease P protein component
MPYEYRKSERLKKNAEFVSTMKGKRLSLDGLSLFYTENKLGNFRIGISVSKRIANAVKRNRLRRRIRDCVMKTLCGETTGYDMVFVARQGLLNVDYKKILCTVEKILLRSVISSQKTEGVTK